VKTTITTFFLFLAACFIFSCSKKDITLNEGTELQQWKITFRDSFTFYHFYERDASNKLIATRDSAKSPRSTIVSTMNVERGANGKVSKVNFQENGNTTTYSYSFDYNPDGTIWKRQMLSGIGDVGDYNTYTYDASGHLAIDSQFRKASNSSVYEIFAVSNFHYTGNNATEAEYYEVANGALKLHTSVKYEYDNAVNPFKNLENNYYINELASSIYQITEEGDNNVEKRYSATGNGAFKLEMTCNYQYNSNNYPSNVKSVSELPHQNPFEMEYSYQ
jgi:hypothetical protein